MLPLAGRPDHTDNYEGLVAIKGLVAMVDHLTINCSIKIQTNLETNVFPITKKNYSYINAGSITKS